VKQLNSRPIDTIDLLSLPAFVGTMIWESRVLARRELREFGDLDDATPDQLSDPRLPPDPLVPVGYERRDTTASLAMLAGNVAVNLALAGVVGAMGRAVFKRRVVDLGVTKWSLPVAMVAWDFLYYWDHRWMHEVRLFWANHVTHHSSERYNLSTALRQPWSGILTSWVFLPMPLLGIPAHHVAKAAQLNLLYQYWIHTEAIDKLPKPIEAVFNTPSHHRGRQPAVPRQELRWDPHRVGPAVRHVRARGAPHQVRPHREHPHVQPRADRLPRVRRHGPRRPARQRLAAQAGPRVRPPRLGPPQHPVCVRIRVGRSTRIRTQTSETGVQVAYCDRISAGIGPGSSAAGS
jgi:hypothetical protein